VVKAIKRAGGKTDFWSIYPYLPRETRGYVPAFIGAMYAFHYAKEYGLQPADVGMPARVDTFEIRRNLHFRQINEVVGVPIETVKLLNPQYTHDIIPGNSGTCILSLPYAWTGPFLSADQDSLYLHRAGELLNAQVLKNIEESGGETRIAYKVKSGDYLGKIASRYGVTVNQIKSWNNLRSNNIQIGQTLYIYTNGGPATSSSSSSSSASKTVIYTVKSGDSLTKIARLYPGVSVDRIKSANGLRSDAIRAGQKLTIPIP
jgi:membrane-bound lytic murein transglycosylase D